MQPTLFPQYVEKYLGPIAQGIVKKINEKKDPPAYLFKEFFKNKSEPSLKFESITGRSSVVSADVVATDSELPLKKRDSIAKSSGNIPKIGMKMQLRESEMINIKILRASGQNRNVSEQIAQLLFSDVKKCIEGVYSRLEYMALEALSTGVMEVSSDNNTGISNRIEFGIPSKNRFGASVKWDDAKAKPLDDIERIVEAARKNGDKITHVLMRPEQFNQLKRNDQVKARYGALLNLMPGNSIVPSVSKVNEFLLEDFRLKIELIDSFVRIEKNGKQSSVCPWEEGKVLFSSGKEFGELVYGAPSEEDYPASWVKYENADDYMLISKFSRVDPLVEFTTVQAYALPVLNDVESLYQLNALDTKWA